MKPRNALHVVRYIRRSGLSLVAQAVLAQLACETNGANGETRIATADLALDIGTSTRQIERALTELRERGILASSGRGTGRVLAIRDQAVAPGYPMANPPPVAETNPPPVAGSRNESANESATGGGPPYLLRSEDQTDGRLSVGSAGEENDRSTEYSTDGTGRLLSDETGRLEPRATRSGEMPPQKPADRTPERSETLARGAPTTPLPPASRAPAAVVRGAQPSTDPLTEVEVAELLALEAEANPERMPSGHAAQATTRLLLDRARAEGWTSATLRALWLEPWTYKLRGRTWSTLFAGGWTPKRTTLLERLRTAAKRPAAPSYDDMTPDEIDALQLRLARERAERFDREEREDDERRSRELRLAAK